MYANRNHSPFARRRYEREEALEQARRLKMHLRAIVRLVRQRPVTRTFRRSTPNGYVTITVSRRPPNWSQVEAWLGVLWRLAELGALPPLEERPPYDLEGTVSASGIQR